MRLLRVIRVREAEAKLDARMAAAFPMQDKATQEKTLKELDTALKGTMKRVPLEERDPELAERKASIMAKAAQTVRNIKKRWHGRKSKS